MKGNQKNDEYLRFDNRKVDTNNQFSPSVLFNLSSNNGYAGS